MSVVAGDQAKEWEHNMFQGNLDKEQEELNKRLEKEVSVGRFPANPPAEIF